jgi:hypothetical protein
MLFDQSNAKTTLESDVSAAKKVGLRNRWLRGGLQAAAGFSRCAGNTAKRAFLWKWLFHHGP